VGDYNEDNEWFHRLAAGGFRDLTRIGASHPIMWRDVLLTNRNELIKLMDDWLDQMEGVRSAIIEKDPDRIERFFTRSKAIRGGLPDRRKGILERRYTLYIDVPDRPGIIGKVATLLGEKQINISNLEVMENREEIPGVLKLTFKKEMHYRNAVKALRAADYLVFEEEERLEEIRV
jgi:prephenate dehydrogenase